MDDAGTGDRIVVGVDGVKVEAAVPGGELAGAASPPGYRDELVCHAVLVDGSVAAIRPIRPDDAVALASFHEGLSTETVHRRFLGSHARLSDVELRRFTTVDYDRRLALVAERDGRWAAVARYDGAAGSDTAEVAFVVADACQHLGLGTLLLEHLAVAARRRGFTRFVADTLGTNAAMQHVFHSSGFECSQRWDSGIASVELPIHPTEAYLEAVSARELLALRRWLLPSVARQPRPSGVGRVGVACQSPPLAAALDSALRAGDLGRSSVLTSHADGDVDVCDLVGFLAADEDTDAIVVELDHLSRPRRAVTRLRRAAQVKPVVALVAAPSGTSIDLRRSVWARRELCDQAGIETFAGIEALSRRIARLVVARLDGSWSPPPRAVLVDVAGCDPAAARRLLDGYGAPPTVAGEIAVLRDLDPGTAEELLATYGIAAERPFPGAVAAGLRLVVASNPVLGLHAVVGPDERSAGRLTGRASVVRFLPLTDVDAVALASPCAPPGGELSAAVDTILRSARLVDDQPDVAHLELWIGAGSAGPAVRVGAVRGLDDDPLVRRIAGPRPAAAAPR